MEKEEIFKSGFIEAFIEGYFEHYTYNHYPSKDRLLYILCSSEEEKEEVTIEQISHAKIKISELGFDELSFSYLKSGKKESFEYIAEKRHEFWVSKFAESFEDDILYFNPIYEAVCLYNEVKKISKECFETEDDFWEFYPDSHKPKIRDLITIFTNEVELIEHIEFEIDNYIESEYWEFDFEEYQKYIEGSKPLELLFNLCELLVQLDRLEMFNSFKQSEQLILAQQIKAEQEQPKTFEELFFDANLVSGCIDILKRVNPPLIDTECNYIGKSKGAFCVWINEMQRQGIVKHYSDRKIFASLLPLRIGRFTIDESMFGKFQKKAEIQYRTDFKTLVSQIKLSQNSQKGKLGK